MINFSFGVEAMVRIEFTQVLICGSMIWEGNPLASISSTLMGVKELESLNSINVNINISDCFPPNVNNAQRSSPKIKMIFGKYVVDKQSQITESENLNSINVNISIYTRASIVITQNS